MCISALAPRGTLCELYIGGEGVARGYCDRKELTTEKFIPNHFDGFGRMYQTGDLVTFGENLGDPINYIGRIDTQVKIRGKRLELDEIKSFICSSTDVKESHVLIKSHHKKDQLVAYIVWNDVEENKDKEEKMDGGLKPAFLSEQLEEKMMSLFKQTLEDYKQPATIVSFPLNINGVEYHDFPITIGGKVDLKILPSPDEVMREADYVSHVALGSATNDTDIHPLSGELFSNAHVATTITKVVREVLGLDHINSHDDFFKSGLTSMEVPTLKFMLKQEFNMEKEISTDCVFENSTVEELANYIMNPQNVNIDVTLCDDDFIDAKHLKDKPLPTIVVWFLSTFNAILAYATSLCFMFFLVLISFEALHEYGKCNVPIERDLQNNCEAPDKWRAFRTLALGLPVVIPSCVLSSLVSIALLKWIVIGHFTPGCYCVDGLYYFRWLYVHNLEVFAIRWLLPTLPMRCTFIYNYWLRLMGAKIGNNVVIDSLDIHEMCCLTIGSDVTIQNDAMLSGHTFVRIKRSSAVSDFELHPVTSGKFGHNNALLIGKCWIKQGATVGPYSMVHPPLPHPTKKNTRGTTIVEGVLPGYQSTSRLGQTIQTEQSHPKGSTKGRDALVWTPRLTILGQLEGLITMVLLQSVAFNSTLWIMYRFFVPAEASFWTWIGRCFLFFSPWPMGVPYATILGVYKYFFIGRFRAGEYSSPRLDKYRWILRCLLQSRIQMAFEVAGASTEILNTFYRMMGMKVGWNTQIVPINIVEFDLFSIGNNCAFGGQVMVCCRDANGKQKACKIGNFSAITNSAGMLAGSSIGDNCLVGNLTLLPPDFSVPHDSKCVGTKYRDGSMADPVVFSNPKGNRNTTRFQSNLISVAHIIAAFLLDLVYFTDFVIVAKIMTACQEANPGKIGQMYLVHNAWKVHGGYLITLSIVCTATIVSTLVIILIKRCTPRFLGEHKRDSLIFVLFIWLTKVRSNNMCTMHSNILRSSSTSLHNSCSYHQHQMNMESWSYVFNGTPIQSFFYRLLGGEISLSSRLFMRFFIDVDGLVIGEKSILGYDSYLEQHKKTSTTLEYTPLNILKNAIVGQRSIILQGASVGNGSQIYPLSAVPPREKINTKEVRGGLLAKTYFERSHIDALEASSHSLRLLLHPTSSLIGGIMLSSPTHSYEVNMVVVGAGVSGIVAAHEFQKRNISVKVLEKTSNIMGCWQTFANPTSHVAVTEATYRLSGTTDGKYAGDYPSRAQVLNHGNDFFNEQYLDKVTEFNAEGELYADYNCFFLVLHHEPTTQFLPYLDSNKH